MTLEQDLARITASMQPITKKQPRFRGCIYGNSGSGKTVLAAQIMKSIVPADKGIIYIDTSEGWTSINNLPGLGEGIMYVPFTTIEDIRLIVSAIKRRQNVFAYIGGIILDEASTMSQIDLDRVFEQRKELDKTNEDNVPGWPDYHAALGRFRIMMAELFDVPDLHVMLLAHVNEKKGAKGEITYTFPAFSPKTAQKVKEPLQLVGYMTVGMKPAGADGVPVYDRQVQVHPTNKLDAKTRIRIDQVRVPAEVLPSIIHDWVNTGGEEVAIDSSPKEDPPELLEPDEEPTPAPTIELADNLDGSLEFTEFEPITE